MDAQRPRTPYRPPHDGGADHGRKCARLAGRRPTRDSDHRRDRDVGAAATPVRGSDPRPQAARGRAPAADGSAAALATSPAAARLVPRRRGHRRAGTREPALGRGARDPCGAVRRLIFGGRLRRPTRRADRPRRTRRDLRRFRLGGPEHPQRAAERGVGHRAVRRHVPRGVARRPGDARPTYVGGHRRARRCTGAGAGTAAGRRTEPHRARVARHRRATT